MEKRNRFMAELRALLTRYHVVLAELRGPEELDVCAVFMDDSVKDPDGYQGHEIYGEDGQWADYPAPEWPDIPNIESGLSYMHCGLCVAEIKGGKMPPFTSPKEYARQQVSYTRQGFQVWCTRHEVNICHIDFGGTRHRANTAYAETPMEKLARAHEEEE
jgi:hypothetical protein